MGVNVIVSLFLFQAALSISPTAAGSSTELRYSEGVLRRKATKVVMPTYPEEAIKKGSQGVSVTQVFVDENGEVYRATVLEAPSPSISEAVERAVKQWRFTVSSLQRVRIRFQGKLTFYFVIEGGKPRVENPRQPGSVKG